MVRYKKNVMTWIAKFVVTCIAKSAMNKMIENHRHFYTEKYRCVTMKIIVVFATEKIDDTRQLFSKNFIAPTRHSCFRFRNRQNTNTKSLIEHFFKTMFHRPPPPSPPISQCDVNVSKCIDMIQKWSFMLLDVSTHILKWSFLSIGLSKHEIKISFVSIGLSKHGIKISIMSIGSSICKDNDRSYQGGSSIIETM